MEEAWIYEIKLITDMRITSLYSIKMSFLFLPRTLRKQAMQKKSELHGLSDRQRSAPRPAFKVSKT